MPRTRGRASARPGRPHRSTSRSDDRSSRIPAASLPNNRRWSMRPGLPRRGRPAASTTEPGFGSCDAPRWSGPPAKIRRSPIPVPRRPRCAAASLRSAASGKRWTGPSFVPADRGSAPKVGWRRTARQGAGRRVRVAQAQRPARPGSPRRRLVSDRSSSSLSQDIKARRRQAPRERAPRGRGGNRSSATRCPHRARACG